MYNKKRSKNLQNFSVARRAQSVNFHTEGDDRAEGAGEGQSSNEIERASVHTHTHTQAVPTTNALTHWRFLGKCRVLLSPSI